MNMNVTFLKVTARASGYVDVEILTREMEAEFAADLARQRSEGKRIWRETCPPRQYTMTIKEAQYAVDCLDGTASFLALIDDINHLVKFARDGMKVIDLEGTGGLDYRAEINYCAFPGGLLSPVMSTAVEKAIELGKTAEQTHSYDDMNARWEYQFSEDELVAARKTSSPKIRFAFHDYGRGNPAQKYMQALRHPLVCNAKTSERGVSLKSQMQGLARIARNQSDGDLVTIHVSLDDMNDPASFYWWIEKNGKQYMNGGIIAHSLRDNSDENVEWYHRPIIGYEYSTHT